MKRRTVLIFSAVAVAVLLAALAGQAFLKRRAATSNAAPAASSEAAAVDMIASDWVVLRTQPLVQGIPVGGSLRAFNSAWVKARVSGELQGLRVREGDAVQAGQLLAQVEPVDLKVRLRQAQQQADAARAQVDIAQRQYNNNKALVDQGFISQTALETSQANLQAAKATQAAASAGADVIRKSINDSVLRAPISGVISQRAAQTGERVNVDARVVEIIDPSRMELEASLSPADSVNVRVGQGAQLRIEGLPQALSAQVTRISPSTQAGTRQVLAYLTVQAHPGLRQGLFAQGMVGTVNQDVLALPLSAVRTDKPQPYVQAVVKGKVAHLPVTIGARGQVAGVDEPYVAVMGLAEGTTVLRGHIGALREGMTVKMTATNTGATSAKPMPTAPASATKGG